jgi:hypothetical protein
MINKTKQQIHCYRKYVLRKKPEHQGYLKLIKTQN